MSTEADAARARGIAAAEAALELGFTNMREEVRKAPEYVEHHNPNNRYRHMWPERAMMEGMLEWIERRRNDGTS